MLEFDKVTTRGGDQGETSLYNGERRRKDDMVFEALGDLDEFVSALGLARAHADGAAYAEAIEAIQRRLFVLGGMVAMPESAPEYKDIRTITSHDVETLEQEEKRLLDATPIAEAFVASGATKAGAFIDMARALCRRTERRIVCIIRERGNRSLIDAQRYLNRLSDYLFILARWVEQR
jgi:cob(I)alamin adenosyltransferase